MATRRTKLRVEALENREMPATLVSPSVVTYQDADGDNVTITFSKAFLTRENAESIVRFDAGDIDQADNTIKQQLQAINLVEVPGAAGTTITVSANRSAVNGGDGFAAVGEIFAKGIDLGLVKIDGDLGRIVAGDATTSTAGLKRLTAHSLGRFGTFTGAETLLTRVQGKLGFLTIKTDVKEAEIDVVGDADGDIGAVKIGGSVFGGDADESGRISATGDLGPVAIKGDLLGGGGDHSGEIRANGRIVAISIGGSLIGGSGPESGQLRSFGSIGAVRIGGSLIGGSGPESGQLRSFGSIGAVRIGGSLIGGSVLQSGRILSNGAIGAVTIGGSLVGGSGAESGQIRSFGPIGVVRIGGSLIGGNVLQSGRIFSNGAIGAVTIGGSLNGGSGPESGQVFSFSSIGAVTIGGSLIGGGEFNSGQILSFRSISAVTIGGSIRGGDGQQSGGVVAHEDLGFLRVVGDVIGGDNEETAGFVFLFGAATSVNIGGDIKGGKALSSGHVFVGGGITNLTIGGSLIGGSATGAVALQHSGSVFADRIGTLKISGSVVAGVDDTTGDFNSNGAIRVQFDIGTATIGNLIGNATNPVLITAGGQETPAATSDLAIGKLTVKGRVEFAQILAGVNPFSSFQNADAQIGAVLVGGDWIASSLVAGAVAGPDGQFGNADDAKISGSGIRDSAIRSSRISSLTIGGQAFGNIGGADHFGIVAESIGMVKIGGTLLPTVAGNSNDDTSIGITGDFKLNEI